MGKIYVSWKAVEDFVATVDKIVRNQYPAVTGVYGLPRGGLVLAVMLSHKLSIPMLMSPTPGCLIVDDICDSGESLIHYVKNSSSPNKPKYVTVTMFHKDNALGVVPNIYWKKKGEDWVIYAWESSLNMAKASFPDEMIKVL